MRASRVIRITSIALILAMPALANAQIFGVQINDMLPGNDQHPHVGLTASATGCQGGPCFDVASFGTGFLVGAATTSASGNVTSSGVFGGATAAGNANVRIGALGATATAHVSSPNTSVDPSPFIGFVNAAEVGFTLSTTDDLIFQSATLANGSLVDVRFTLTLASSVVEAGAFSGSRGRVAASLRFDAEGGPNPSLNIEEGTTNGPPAQRTISKTLALEVGQTYRLLQDLEISGFGNAQWTGFTSGVTPENWTLNIDAAHTSLAFVDVLGDATLVAASGHDYRLAPVPLPAAVWLLSSALGGLGCIRRL